MASKNGKPKQQHLPTMEPEKIPKIERLADRYVEKRDERMRLADEEADAKDLLHTAMKEAKLPRYEYGARVVEVTTDENVKVRKAQKETVDA